VIPSDYIAEWRAQAPWATDSQVEQDLILSRAVVAMYSESDVARGLAFRGATALCKLHLGPPARYSEDIDLVQISAGPIGGVLNAIRRALDPWLGLPRRATKEDSIVLIYRMRSEGRPSVPMRLKVEINSREHFSVFGIEEHEFVVQSRWFTGSTKVKTYHLDELLGTKLRARTNARSAVTYSTCSPPTAWPRSPQPAWSSASNVTSSKMERGSPAPSSR
jgi:predicted nucleotidyltransferase component of viral defense system